MENKPTPLQIIIINLGQKYIQEDDREVRKYIGLILEGKVKIPYRGPQRRRGRGEV